MIRTFYIGLICISLTIYSCGQGDKRSNATEEIIDPVQKLPIFPGGQEGLSRFLKSHADKWKQENKNEIKGKLFIEFIVTETGETEDVKIVKEIGEIPKGVKDAAIEAIDNMPKWEPMTYDNKLQRVSMAISISF